MNKNGYIILSIILHTFKVSNGLGVYSLPNVLRVYKMFLE